jgi:monovalent cation:H+ antiporter-2, CPA2 family
VGLTQIGEFSFILVKTAREAGHVGDDVYGATLAASLITILLNAALVHYVPTWIVSARLARARRGEPWLSPDDPPPAAHAVVCGFGRVGSAVGEALQTFGIPYVVIERDPDVAADLRARGIPCLFGDAAYVELLHRAGVDRARLVVVALPEIEAARLAVRAVKTLNAQVPILARAHRRAEAEHLREYGASEVIQPELEAGATLVRHALQAVQVPSERAREYLERFRAAMGMTRVDPAADELPGVQEVTLPAGGIADQTLREAQVRERFGVIVVAIRRGEVVTVDPDPDTVLRAGDHIKIFGLPDQIAAFMVGISS